MSLKEEMLKKEEEKRKYIEKAAKVFGARSPECKVIRKIEFVGKTLKNSDDYIEIHKVPRGVVVTRVRRMAAMRD